VRPWAGGRGHAKGVTWTVFAVLAALPACAPGGGGRATAAGSPESGTAATAAAGPRGVVVSSAPLASEVGAAVLREGGNAVDAAVASAFALAVVEPSMSGLGGRTQILIRMADGVTAGYDGTTEVPAGYGAPGTGRADGTTGYGTIGIPGTVAALARAQEAHGSWPLARVVEPAIRLAEDGFPLPETEADRIAGAADDLRRYAGSAAYFLRPDGTPPPSGSRFRQPDLARTLRRIARNGAEGFYAGEVAARIHADMEANGGSLRAGDLAAYRVRASEVVRGRFRSHHLVGTYLPASGATTIEALQILESFQPERDAEWIATVAGALVQSFMDRDSAAADPAVGGAWLVSRERAAHGAARLRDRVGAPDGSEDGAAERGAHARGAAGGAAGGTAGGTAGGAGREPGGPPGASEPAHTTHLSVLDGAGSAVALTQSLGPSMGSRVAAPGLGFLYASTMGYLEDERPGGRPWSSQSPLIVLDGATADARPYMVAGGAGARRIISALVQTTFRVLADGRALEEAMAMPRFHVSGRTLYLERRPGAAWGPEVDTALARLGLEVEPRLEGSYFARLNVILVDPETGAVHAVSDPRGAGAAAFP
jgi:gamma-glutamyltranspeptidase/glutathione hydrolase